MHRRYFNPHSREGSDAIEEKKLMFMDISIHTPAKGVTMMSLQSMLTTTNFNPHSREGSDV